MYRLSERLPHEHRQRMTVTRRDEKSESFAHSVVPAEATGSAAKIFFIIAGSCCGLPVFVLSSGITTGLGFHRALAVFLLGGLVAAVLGAASAFSGARTRMTLAQLAETTFGVHGAKLVQTAITLALFGWFGVGVSVLGATATSAIWQVAGVEIPTLAVSLPLCVLITLIALRGLDGLERLGMVLVPLTFVLLLLAVFMTRATFVAASSGRGTGSMTFGGGVSAVVGAYIVGIIIQPDYGRFVRSPGRAALAVLAALGLAYPLILGLSAIPAMALGKPDLITALILLHIGLPALVLLLMGAWIDCSTSLYSGGLALAKLIPGIRFHSIILGGGVVGMALALAHVERHFVPFLMLLGVLLPPVAAVQCVTALWPEKSWPETELARSPVPMVRMGALAAWGIGIAVSVVAEHLGVPLTGIPAVDSILGSGLATVCLRLCALTRSRGTIPQPEV